MKVPIPNTPENQFDPSYRYMRDSLKISKQSNSFVIENMDQIAKQLHVSVNEIRQYLLTKLNQPIVVDKKSGHLKIKSLPIDFESMFESFILKHVICQTCNKPELNQTNRICDSCGQTN
jgi:translation initiation factor 2 beta subunit (eIF-2beta)/eIF-5